MFEDLSPVILFRMSERLLLTVMVVVVALVILVGFWKTVQRISVTNSGPVGLAGSMALSTPVFALLAIILYAWVSLSHPIALTGSPVAPGTETSHAAASVGANPAQFTGAVNTNAQQITAQEVSVYALQRTRQQVWTLNCLAAATTVRPPAESDLTDVKLALMGTVWQVEWGNRAQFESWARTPNSDTKPPMPALDFYNGKHTGC